MRSVGWLADEEGTIVKDAPLRVVLLYPSGYHVGMSSLGFQQIYRRANQVPGVAATRAFLPERDERADHARRALLAAVETGRPVGDHHVIGISLAYELELTGVVRGLTLAGLPPLAEDRDPRLHPLVVLGGPITFSNPLPAAPFADLLVLGEAEGVFETLLHRVAEHPGSARGSAASRAELLASLVGLPGFYVPSLEGEALPHIAACDDAELPAFSQIRTPHTELAGMHLVEAERGCSRGCTFCVLRRSTNGGMRIVPPERVLATIPPGARRVGLVGAAVSDHPRIQQILRAIVDERGLSIGISSLRAERLDDEFVGLLARGGYRSLTVASDAASERLRREIDKNLREHQLLRAAELARRHGMGHLKVYGMLGLPGETDADVDELVRFTRELCRILKVVLAVSPFVPKWQTPLADAPFTDRRVTQARLGRLARELRGAAELRTDGARAAYIEYRLAQGGHAHARAAIAAESKGGTLGAWEAALRELPERVPIARHAVVALPVRRRREAPVARAPAPSG